MTEPRLLVAASSHRSGSTLLQRYVTARTTTFVWGENGPFIESLIQAVEGWPQTKRNEREYERVILDPSLSERRYVPNLSPPREAVERAREELLRQFRAGDAFRADDFRDRLGTTRKWAIPLLEHCDAQGLTELRGSTRVLKTPLGELA